MDASKSFGKKHEEWSPAAPSIICHEPPSSSSSYGKKWKEVLVKRRKVKKALETFHSLFCKLMCKHKEDQTGDLKANTKMLMEAAMLMKSKHQWENTQKRVGHVIGIDIGDQFQYRAELNVIGLHRQFSSGIDYMGIGRNSLATSIVVTNRYDNARKSNGSLVYIGHGGNPNVSNTVLLQDQKLEGGNLALKNSMDAKSPVRVILKVCGKSEDMVTMVKSSSHCSFFYDGLYLVEKMTQERGKFGKLVFKFTLNRILEQPRTCVAIKDDITDDDNNSGQYACFTARKGQKPRACGVQKDVVRMNDVSKGKEKFPIRMVTSMDCVQIPSHFDYIVNNIYSEGFKQPILCGCDCTNGCVDYEKCPCIVRNGGRMPYDCNKRFASPMKSSLIYECGPSCNCSSSCINRVSQHGIQFQLEIFMTESKGWGVRTRSFISSGSFVCEYIGEVHNNREAGSRPDVDEHIFKMGFGKGFIDATRRGNIGRFINHSCSPNLCVKDVMYDHNDKSLPHKILFAVKDIPAGRELSYDYNGCKGKFIKVRSNICHCGSRECNGQIYV
ncbi:histone-lysine N-methyltransferase, H3 lysine-9 specific SUVH5-like [Abrus precatorius]|uniref:Histone-lysine N-methyltransferase, H3 lysine-9 specific SUVH5-like n=1 Tax=Abrus precatorius TaxID=3816 RepID=A0A8B8MG10_ABRPR|nr:histone-lysine N-methyltransferase, H3 lysine-9 specific SUVH5-like [Abrus precatorius]